MLIEAQKARDLKLELFEQATQEELQDELQEWLSSRAEEIIVGVSFDASTDDATPSYRAQVFYTE